MATVKSYSLNADNTGNGAGSIRTVVASALIGGDRIRATFVAASAATFGCNNASIGVQSSGSATVATPVELKFSGISGFSIANGATITSDFVGFNWAAGNNLIVVFDTGVNGNWRELNAGGDGFYFGAGASYNQSAPAGFSLIASRTEGINLLDGQNVPIFKPVRRIITGYN